ncbi:MAG: cupin domain-containing protein [Thermodesulfobacteriota bacterium]
MQVIDTNKLRRFSKEGFQPQILHASPGLKVPLICMEDGQLIPPHPGGIGVFYVIEGKAIFTIGDERREVEAGSVVIAPSGVKRGVEAMGRLVMIAFHST